MSTIFADPIAAAQARVIGHFTGTAPTVPATAPAPVTVPDGWALEHVGDAWSVGPIGTGTHLLVDELWQIPGAIRTFEQQLARAARFGGVR